ncbi:AI-2E family transporter [Azospirillum sp.]|uniref:AI-2E family transporter n=1 Tax=Azospirillum sp. TaxID=34012 RepID=UPI002D5D4FD2|nr:AI-2E family transporter [Azospirillum sp.]HYD68876.1 AI-2E family transporter [Azospirillum sp.]
MDGKRDAARALGRLAQGVGNRDAEDQAGVAPRHTTTGELRVFTWKVLIVAGVAALAYLLVQISHAVLLAFAGVLFAILLRRIAGLLKRFTGLSEMWGLAAILVTLLAAVVGGGWLVGAWALGEVSQLSDQIGRAIDQLPKEVRDQISGEGGVGPWLGRLRQIAPSVVYFIGDAIIVLFIALYVAATPGVYRRGLVLLVPPAGHKRAYEVLDTLGDTLWKWLIGQFISMAIVGALTTAGLMLLGVPAALGLGVLAMVLEFIPFIGPILAAMPALLIAFTQDAQTVLWVGLLYLVIQQAEGQLVTPLVQKRIVDLPPAVTIGAITAGGLLFGLLGMFLAAPLAVTALVLVNLLYIEDKLGEEPHFPS